MVDLGSPSSPDLVHGPPPPHISVQSYATLPTGGRAPAVCKHAGSCLRFLHPFLISPFQRKWSIWLPPPLTLQAAEWITHICCLPPLWHDWCTIEKYILSCVKSRQHTSGAETFIPCLPVFPYLPHIPSPLLQKPWPRAGSAADKKLVLAKSVLSRRLWKAAVCTCA